MPSATKGAFEKSPLGTPKLLKHFSLKLLLHLLYHTATQTHSPAFPAIAPTFRRFL